MMNRTIKIFCLLLFVCTAVQAEEWPQITYICPSKNYTADVSVWDFDGDQGKSSYFPWVMNGYADMRPLSQFIIQQGTKFEQYMGTRVGNFQVLDAKTDNIDPWNSLLFKLNALAGPILAAPYEIEHRTKSSAHKQTLSNGMHGGRQYMT
eukprot:Clim_evm6s10 gene=Clim_evmTU6s10